MTKISETIVFFGSGPVAAKALGLLSNNFEVEAVVTKSSTANLMSSATNKPIPIYEVNSKQELDDLVAKKPFRSRLGVLVDFGIIVSQAVIDYFQLGIVNSHFSVLPQWRGADPITFVILSGQRTTGVSLMTIDAGLDTGKILVTKSLPIKTDETAPELTERLIDLSDQLLVDYLPRYIRGEVKPRQQSHPDRATYSRKLTKDDSVLDWSKPAKQLEREVRAFIEWPRSITTLGGKEVIITKTHVESGNGQPGTIWRHGKQLGIYTATDILAIDKLKPAGKSEMSATAFLAGYGKLL